MKKISFNKNWEFTFENDLDVFNGYGFDKYSDAIGAPGRYYENNNWERIDLPHDWAVALSKDLRANTFAGARPNTRFHRFMTERHSDIEEVFNIGWYRKSFNFDPEWVGKRIFIEFEGIFRDAKVWVNGTYMTHHNSGYTSFLFEITEHLLEDDVNSIAVRVDSEQAEGWWYEGSGIYRNVNIIVGEPIYVKPNKTFIKTELDGLVSASAVLVNDTARDETLSVEWSIIDRDGVTAASKESRVSALAYKESKISIELNVTAPKLWSVEEPNLYTLSIKVGDEESNEKFGIRTVGFDPDKGFLLNGKPLKIRGACVHQDFGGVGVALTDNLHYYKIQRLKDMGVNAYRSSHHAPSPVLLNACDELGMLVMDETRLFGTSPEAITQLTDIIERDRNHPCVFIWSLGNEEFSIQNKPWSARLMKKMSRIAKSLDDTRPVTYSGNNGNNYDGANSVSEVRGINYIRSGTKANTDKVWVDIYHKDHPHQPMIGTEESSYVLSRGSAENDLGSGLLDSTGTVTMLWGSTPKGWVKFFEERDFLAGSFMWTGFDYRGEPNPFVTANVASSFGTIDLCGMEKPPFYYYKAWWTDEPVLKLTPHWNHKEGSDVTLAVFTNCEEITLLINGREVETRKVERFDSPLFTVPFEAGVVSVKGTRNGEVLYDEIKTSKDTSSVKCVNVLEANDGSDIAIYQLEAYDEDGVFCPLAYEKLEISIENGALVGVGNGDPSDLEYDQKPKEYEEKLIRTFGYEKGLYSLPNKEKNCSRMRYDWLEIEPSVDLYEDDFRNVTKFKDSLKAAETFNYVTKISGVEGYQYLEFERLGGASEVYINGEFVGDNFTHKCRIPTNNVRPYRFYYDFKKGENEIRVVSTRDESSGLPISGYVKIGREKTDTPWTVNLHYGLARVFVKSETPDKVKLNVKIK